MIIKYKRIVHRRKKSVSRKQLLLKNTSTSAISSSTVLVGVSLWFLILFPISFRLLSRTNGFCLNALWPFQFYCPFFSLSESIFNFKGDHLTYYHLTFTSFYGIFLSKRKKKKYPSFSSSHSWTNRSNNHLPSVTPSSWSTSKTLTRPTARHFIPRAQRQVTMPITKLYCPQVPRVKVQASSYGRKDPPLL